MRMLLFFIPARFDTRLKIYLKLSMLIRLFGFLSVINKELHPPGMLFQQVLASLFSKVVTKSTVSNNK